MVPATVQKSGEVIREISQNARQPPQWQVDRELNKFALNQGSI